MKRVLIITHSFPPLLEPRAIQIAKIARHLERFGWHPIILAADPDRTSVGQDPDLSSIVPASVTTIRTPTFEPRWAVSLLARTCPSILHLPDKQIGWFPYAVGRASRLLSASRVDLILTNAKPFTDHLIGLALQRRHDIRWVAYFSDPWVDSPYFMRYAKWQVRRNRRMEARALANADGLVFNNPETAQLMLGTPVDEAPGRCLILPHCFDAELLELARSPDRPADPKALPVEAFRIVHTGNFYGIRSPVPFLEAVRDVRSTVSRPVEVLLVGKLDKEHQEAIERRDLRSVARLIGSVGYLESLSYIQTADLLVNIDAPVAEHSVFFPSKLVDYLGSGIPILGITPPNSTAARILREHGQYVADVNDPASVRRALRAAIEGRMKACPVPGEFDAIQVACRLAGYMDRVAAGGPSRTGATL